MNKRKYPSTPHLPFSKSIQVDDISASHFAFYGNEGVVTEKMDGENTTLYSHSIHARSLDSQDHPSRSFVKAHHGGIAHLIPTDTRVIVESLYAEHSIRYDNLRSYIMGIAVVKKDVFLSWEDSVHMFSVLNFPSVPVLYRGVITPDILKDIAKNIHTEKQEGFVVRSAGSFDEKNFGVNVAKWVRPHHVQTTEHWTRNWKPNTLTKNSVV